MRIGCLLISGSQIVVLAARECSRGWNTFTSAGAETELARPLAYLLLGEGEVVGSGHLWSLPETLDEQSFANRNNPYCGSVADWARRKLANLLIAKAFHLSVGSANCPNAT
jgi:hypothetical protein